MERAYSGDSEQPKKVQKTDQPPPASDAGGKPAEADEPPPASDAGGKPADSTDNKRQKRGCYKVRLGNGPRVCTTIEDCYPPERVASVEFFPALTTPEIMASLDVGAKAALDEYPRQITFCNPSSEQPFPFPKNFGTEQGVPYGWDTVLGKHHKGIPYLETLVLNHLPKVKGFYGLNALSLRILEVNGLNNVTNVEFRNMAKLLILEELTVKNCEQLSCFEILPEDSISKKLWRLKLRFSKHQEGELRIDDMEYMYSLETNARRIQGRFDMPRLRFLTINVRHVKTPSEVLDMLKELFELKREYKLDELYVDAADYKKFWSKADTKLFCEAVAAFNAENVSLTGITQDAWRMELKKELKSYPIDVSF